MRRSHNMKILETPQSGRRGDYVYYMRGKKLCRRRYVTPAHRRTAAQVRARGALGAMAIAWHEFLKEEQRRAWNAAGPKVLSHPRLGQSGPLTGQQHFAGINSARAGIGRKMLLWPPERVEFGPNPVEGLRLSDDQGRMRLKLSVSGLVVEDIMVFGAAPCSAGRKKWRHGAYLGLLPAPLGGESDITDLYVGRYGEPKVGERVFIRIRQQVDGWEGDDKDISEVVWAEAVAAARKEEIRSPKSEVRRKSGIRSPKVAWSGGVAGSVGRIGRKGCTREQHHGFAIPSPWQCRGAGRYSRPIRKVGPVCGVWAVGEVRWNGHWRELWHGT
jgi:hypothetical protein